MPDTHDHNGHTFTTDRLDDGSDPTYAACSVVCLDPVLDDQGIDQTPWPSDETVSLWFGLALKAFDRGDSQEGTETIYHLRA